MPEHSANYTDDHIPVPAEHVPTLHAYAYDSGAGQRLILSEGRTMDDVREADDWLAMPDPYDLGVWR